MKRTLAGIGLPLIAVLAVGFTSSDSVSAEDITIDEIIEQAQAAEESLGDHFIEHEILSVYEDEEEMGLSRQWVKHDGDVMMMRIETGVEGDLMVIVDDGEETILYDEAMNVAYRLSEDEIALFVTTPAFYLEALAEVYDITVEGTESVNGRDAYHLVLEANESYQEFVEEESIVELWVDTEYFIVLKEYEEDAIYGIYDSEFVEFESDIDIEDELFVLELPEDIEIQDGLFNFSDEDFEFDFEDELEFDLDTEEGSEDEDAE